MRPLYLILTTPNGWRWRFSWATPFGPTAFETWVLLILLGDSAA